MRYILLSEPDDLTLVNQPISIEEQYSLPMNEQGETVHVVIIVAAPWSCTAVERCLWQHAVPFVRADQRETVLTIRLRDGCWLNLGWSNPSLEATEPVIYAEVVEETPHGQQRRSGYAYAATVNQAVTQALARSVNAHK